MNNVITTRSHKRLGALLALLAIVAGVTVLSDSSAQSSAESLPSETSQERVITRTAIIRVGIGGPYLHTNETHGSIGVTKVELFQGCDVKVTWDGRFPGEKILAANVDEDESLSQKQVQAGFTGNVTTSVIKMYRNGVHMCANNKSLGNYSNLWVNLTSERPVA